MLVGAQGNGSSLEQPLASFLSSLENGFHQIVGVAAPPKQARRKEETGEKTDDTSASEEIQKPTADWVVSILG